MSFYAAFLYYRPCTPPRVTVADLARFVSLVRESRATRSSSLMFAKVKFGESIDQDSEDMSASEPTGTGFLTIAEKPYDIDENVKGLAEIQGLLESNTKVVYRAHLGLGALVDDAAASISRVKSLENEIDFTPDEVSLEIGPIRSAMLNSETVWHVGWIVLRMHGYGYLWPWTLRDIIERAEASLEIGRLTELCRSVWPLADSVPDREDVPKRRSLLGRLAALWDPESADSSSSRAVTFRSIAHRKEMGELWPYEIDRPWDWSWGIHET